MASTFVHRRVTTVLLIYTVVVSFYAIIGQVSFGRLYGDLDTEFTKAFSFPEKRVFGDGRGSELQHFIRSWVSLFALTTTENYPGIAYPALLNGNKLALFYFVSFIILGIYLILNVLLAATYRSWKEEHSKQLLNMRVVRYHNLLIAWQLLLDKEGVNNGKRLLSYESWCEMLRVVKPSETQDNYQAMFQFMDRDRSGAITRKEFLLYACDALKFDFKQYYRRQALKKKDGGLLCCYDHVLDDSFRESLIHTHSSRAYQIIGYLTVTIGLLPLMCRVWDDDGNLTSPLPRGTEEAMGLLTSLLFTIGQFANLLLLPPFECWSMAKQIDFVICFLFVVATIIAIQQDTIPYHGKKFRPSYLDRVLFSCRILLVLRYLTLSTKVRNEMSTTWRIRHAILNFLFVAVVVIYAFAMLGVSLMHGYLSPRHLYDADPPGENWVDDVSVGQSMVALNNYGNIFMALLQIGVDNNWQDILWANTLETSAPMNLRWAIGLYFVSFFVIMGWFGLNILTALVIETYDYAKAKTLEAARQSEAAKAKKGYAWDGAAAVGSVVVPGQECDCMKCGNGGCAVFVPTIYDKNLCQCGHASLYHHIRGEDTFETTASEDDEEPRDVKLVEGWNEFKKGDQNHEVPQYEPDFDVEADLEDESVLKLLELSMTRTHILLFSDIDKMHSQFRELLRSRGLIPITEQGGLRHPNINNPPNTNAPSSLNGGGNLGHTSNGMNYNSGPQYGNANDSNHLNSNGNTQQPSHLNQGNQLEDYSVHFGSAFQVSKKSSLSNSNAGESGQGSRRGMHEQYQQQQQQYQQQQQQQQHQPQQQQYQQKQQQPYGQYNNSNNFAQGGYPPSSPPNQFNNNYQGKPSGWAMNMKRPGASSSSGSSTRGF